jgi:membrane protease YdiL (CAAX protease family)
MKDRFKPLYALLLLFLGAPVTAALFSPWIYRGLQCIAPDGSVWDAPFHRVTSRVVLVAVAVFLYPAYKLSGIRSKADCGLTGAPDRFKQVRLGILLGMASMLIVYLLGVALGVFAWNTGGKAASVLVRKSFQALAGGLAVGIFEEILFRGFILAALRKSLGVIAAVLIGSFLFSIVHFMRPVDPETVGQWNSGFLMLGSIFARAGNAFLQEACTLFCMGTVLSVLTLWTRSIYVAIGLHTGWVWVMMLCRLFYKNLENMTWLYGTSDWISKAWIGPILALVFLTAVFLTKKKWQALAASPT